MTYEPHETRNALFAFLAGLATGGIIVALTTPRSGPELRRDMARQGRRLRGRLNEMLDRGEDYLDACAEDLGDRAGKAAEDARDAASRVGRDLSRGAERVGQDLQG